VLSRCILLVVVARMVLSRCIMLLMVMMAMSVRAAFQRHPTSWSGHAEKITKRVSGLMTTAAVAKLIGGRSGVFNAMMVVSQDNLQAVARPSLRAGDGCCGLEWTVVTEKVGFRA
jgi:hypothetical protein